jgi:hypothetical protein
LVDFFAKASASNLQLIVEYILSIPASNGHLKKMFSIMKDMYTDKRNPMRLEIVKAELCVHVNYNFMRLEPSEFVSKEKSLPKASRTKQKYNFK